MTSVQNQLKIRFVVTVDGVASKFSLRNTVLNVGNGLALLGITTVIGEFFLLYFAKERKNVSEKKYDYIQVRINFNFPPRFHGKATFGVFFCCTMSVRLSSLNEEKKF